ncbi:hypothetical protein C7Y08_001228, partial [Neisseria gonorrhoeae]
IWVSVRTCSDFRLRGNDDSGITDDSSGRRVGFSPPISPHQGFWGIGVTRRFRFLAKLVGIGGLKHTLQSTLQPILRIYPSPADMPSFPHRRESRTATRQESVGYG